MPTWKRGEVWYGYVRVNGLTSARKSTGCHDRKAAEKVLLQWERDLADPAYAAAQKACLDEACDRLLKEYRALVSVKKKSAATEGYYADKLGTVARILGPKLPARPDRSATVDSYIAARRKEQASENTIGKELDALKVVLRHAKRGGQWAGDIEAIFPTFSKEYRPRKRALTAREVQVLLREMPRDLAAQMAFAIATSAEAKCILEAQKTDVMEDGRFVLLRGTKRELRQRTVPIVAQWQKDLLAFALENAEGEAPYLFKRTTWGLRNTLRRTCKRLGLDHASPNDLRRTFAVGMREAGVPLELIARRWATRTPA
jgi:integrase